MRWVFVLLLIVSSSLFFVAASSPVKDNVDSDTTTSVGQDFHFAPPLNEVTKNRIDSFFSEKYKHGKFNGTYLFFRNDSLVSGALGYSNFSTRRPNNPDDLFQLASVSKTFTGVSFLKMQQEGLLNIRDSVHWHLPDFKRKNLTIWNLLTHSSGLPDYFNLPVPNGISPNQHMYNEDVLKLMNSLSYKSFASPGRYKYSNTNYVLLALIIERKTGIGFRKYVTNVIFKPAGMLNSHICDFDSNSLKTYPVQGYMNGKVYTDLPHNGTTGDKGVYSSVFEMLKYDRALRSELILNSTSKELMYSPQVDTDNNGASYGLGWRMKVVDGHKWVYHNGWWKGFRTYFWRSLEENKMYCVLTNDINDWLPTAVMVSLLN